MNNDTKRIVGLALAVLAITGAIVYLEAPWDDGSTVPPPPEDAPASALEKPGAPDFQGAKAWVNGDPVELTEQRGKVVLVDFWTYSCRNCINTFPYLRAWHDAYADDGLVIVGVHTPEFRFERDVDNVRQATDRYNLTYPVAIDNGYEIWNAYHNRFWPAKYLIDQYGRIQYTHFGEGAYEETEDKIRQLLKEAGHEPGPRAQVDSKAGGVRAGQTPELFASHLDGYKQHAIANEEGYEPGQTITYAPVEDIEPDRIYLEGTWFNHDQFVRAEANATTVQLSFKAGGTNFVASPVEGACVEILLDGEPIARNLSGPDVSFEHDQPCVPLDEHRAYDVYSGPFERHHLELKAPQGFELYSFAFSSEGRT